MASFTWRLIRDSEPDALRARSGAYLAGSGNPATSVEESVGRLPAPDLEPYGVLVVDCDPARFQLTRQQLHSLGCRKIFFAPGSAEAVELYVTLQPDLVILRPERLDRDCLDEFARAQAAQPAIGRAPILLSSAQVPGESVSPDLVGFDLNSDLYRDTVIDYISPDAGQEELSLRVRNLLRVRELVSRLRRQQEWLEQAVVARTRSLQSARRQVLDRLARVAQYRDDGTSDHTRRVGYLAARTAQAMNLEPGFVEMIASAALLHDLGKIGIPDAILHKPGPLSAEEFEVIKAHPQIGADILAGSTEPILQMAREIALSHHERWNGKGYPNGLAREAIPLPGRIVAVCDVYDALTKNRVYRPALDAKVAIQMIVDGRGSEFDPKVVDAFLSIADKLDDESEEDQSDQPAGTGYLGS
jgi:putative two-component system response regulator